MILTNIDHVKGRTVQRSIGLAFGYASVQGAKKGKRTIQIGEEKWPWADTADHFEALFREAERRLALSGTELGADAIIKVEARLSRNLDGHPEIVLVGTAVRLSGHPGKDKDALSQSPGDEKASETGIKITFGGEEPVWEQTSTTPTKDVLRMMRQKDGDDGPRAEGENEERDTAMKALAEKLDVSFERAQQLFDAGLGTLESIAKADLKLLSSLPKMNPTQARILKANAKETQRERNEGA